MSVKGSNRSIWSDIIALIRVHHLSLDDAEFHAMVLRHGGIEGIERIKQALAE